MTEAKKSLTLAERRAQIRRTMPRDEASYPEWVKPEGRKHFDLMIHALGLAGEAGETADYLKKVYGHGHELEPEKLKKELGDVEWYQHAVAEDAGLSADEIASANEAKLRARFPDGFNSRASQERRDLGPSIADIFRPAIPPPTMPDRSSAYAPPEFIDLLACHLFSEYNEQGPNPWRTHDGKPVPTWPQLGPQVQEKWRAVARAAIDRGMR